MLLDEIAEGESYKDYWGTATARDLKSKAEDEKLPREEIPRLATRR
jgi:hypothetical protein